MMKYIVIFLFVFGCSKKQSKIEIWGDKTNGWSMEAKKASGEVLFRVSDDAKDTTAFVFFAKNWLKQ
jgi:hypothetical protein